MDKRLHFLFLLLFLASCTPTTQLYQVSSPEVQPYENDAFAYENEDIAIAYDFWTNGGTMLFSITNKSDRSLFLDFQLSQFIIQQDTFDYHNDFFELESTHHPSSNTNDQSTISPIVCLKPQGSQTIEGYPITYDWKRAIKKGRSYTYEPEQSPIRFSNIIVYSFDPSFATKTVAKNTFSISEIEEVKGKQWKALNESNAVTSNRFYVQRNQEEDSFYFLEFLRFALDLTILFL